MNIKTYPMSPNEDELRVEFERQHKGRALSRHRLRGTYHAAPIAALWNQHLRTANWLTANESSQGWISIQDRLPEWASRDDTPCIIEGKHVPPTLTSLTVLVALESGGVRTDKLTAIEGSAPWFDTYRKRVTHWKPLPPPPIMETK